MTIVKQWTLLFIILSLLPLIMEKPLSASDEALPAVFNKIKSGEPGQNKLTFHKKIFIGVADGPDEYMLNSPSDVAVDDKGNFFILDNCRIRKFDPQGKFLTAFSQKGEGPGEILNAEKIQTDPRGNVYVFDWEAQRVSKFKNDGTFDDSIRTLFMPKKGVVDSKGNIFIYNLHGDFLLHKLSADGKSKTSFIPAHESKEASFRFHINALGAIAITPDDRIYLLTPFPNTIYICDTSGKVLKKIVNDAFFASPPHISGSGARINQYRPLGIHVLPSGHILARHYRFEIPGNAGEKEINNLFDAIYTDYSYTSVYDPAGKFQSLMKTGGFAENGCTDVKGGLCMIIEDDDGFKVVKYSITF